MAERPVVHKYGWHPPENDQRAYKTPRCAWGTPIPEGERAVYDWERVTCQACMATR